VIFPGANVAETVLKNSVISETAETRKVNYGHRLTQINTDRR